ncbi:MAG TPA: hypothetical protein VFT59_00815 [Candidatus Saccharimonadales bacterium]|nr:hypothetical protein [Candidatus Saccharimonadales bacterium]
MPEPVVLFNTSIIVIVIVLAGLLTYGIVKAFPYVLGKIIASKFPLLDLFPVLSLIVASSYLLSGGIFSFIFSSFKNIEMDRFMASILLMYAIALLCCRLAPTIQLLRKRSMSITKAYMQTYREFKRGWDAPSPGLLTFIFVAYVMMLGLVSLPFNLGVIVATTKTDFTAISDSVTDGDERVNLIIGRTNDSFIVKEYDSRKREFSSGSTPINATSVTFQPYTIPHR